jgi:hypothetical protein
MHEILEFLVRFCPYLWAEARYRIVDSEMATGFGDTCLIVGSERLRLRFVRDRGQLYLEFQAAQARDDRWHDSDDTWYDIDLVQELLTGTRPASAELDADHAAFLERNLQEIESRFADHRPETEHQLEKLRRARAQKQLG